MRKYFEDKSFELFGLQKVYLSYVVVFTTTNVTVNDRLEKVDLTVLVINCLPQLMA